jgi:hypothetical protein
MTSDAVKPKKTWTKPHVGRLGRIKDVTAAQGVGAQGAGAKT